MDLYRLTLELKEMLTDYGVVFPYDPYGALDLESTVRDFLAKHIDPEINAVFDLGYDEGLEAGFNDGYAEAEYEFS